MGKTNLSFIRTTQQILLGILVAIVKRSAKDHDFCLTEVQLMSVRQEEARYFALRY